GDANGKKRGKSPEATGEEDGQQGGQGGDDDEAGAGPTCWKCRGERSLLPRGGKGRRKRPASAASSSGEGDEGPPLSEEGTTASSSEERRPCPVCGGTGRLPVRAKYLKSRSEPGAVTARRRRPGGWREFGHVPPAVSASRAAVDDDAGGEAVDDEHDERGDAAPLRRALALLRRANGPEDNWETRRKDVSVLPSSADSIDAPSPPWLPVGRGEQLCNLAGRWRILQRLGSHRWTTDDLVTAHVAAEAFSSSSFCGGAGEGRGVRTVRYLDLGTGNASVLQMVSWRLLSELPAEDYRLKAVGVEARSEAVGLARRSLAFNLGPVEFGGKSYAGAVEGRDGEERAPATHDVRVVRGDFRDLVPAAAGGARPSPTAGWGSVDPTVEDVASERYDLVTGTPPYFRVGFAPAKGGIGGGAKDDDDADDGAVASAVIQQGGMPTSVQSAPARCEFRGGVEAYCRAASALLSPDGLFVVCENWANDDRVWRGAEEAGLDIEGVCPVVGGMKKGGILFAVYVMRRQRRDPCREDGVGRREGVVRPSLAVRDKDGKYTPEYARVLEAMSIPVV
ncbi:hypothetical protein ACHAWF_002312, partial [Thalassiosira exigua]